MRLLVTGTSGQVARALAERAAVRGISLFFAGRPAFDLEHPPTLRAPVLAARPHIIIAAAAFTDVDGAEADPARAFAVNAHAAGALAGLAAERGIPIIHLSTDHVFDGRGSRAYTEDDPLNPLNVYGRSKQEGERLVAAATDNHVVLRTQWIYSPFGRNFLKTVLARATDRHALDVVADQTGAPTSALEIADTLLDIAGRLVCEPRRADLRGIFHLAAAGRASRADFAAAIVKAAEAVGAPPVRIVPVTSAQYPALAQRPKNACLNTRKLADVYGIRLAHWEQPLGALVRRVMAAEGRHRPLVVREDLQ